MSMHTRGVVRLSLLMPVRARAWARFCKGMESSGLLFTKRRIRRTPPIFWPSLYLSPSEATPFVYLCLLVHQLVAHHVGVPGTKRREGHNDTDFCFSTG